jgi:hypothetical protein
MVALKAFSQVKKVEDDNLYILFLNTPIVLLSWI